ncbi:MAG: sugar transferase [Clostridia bacterium]|nr:sugar transferase [Clostridia bacterium]
MYAKLLKRPLDFILSLMAMVALSPLLVILTVIGTIAMRGNPFFVQERPGKISSKTGEEKIFKLVKFRTMSDKRDSNGILLADEQRLNAYGRFLRSTSCDELPSLINIICGDLSIVGPRPLLVQYIPLYTEEQRTRHTVRPGLTGYAQVHGRNAISWEEKFKYDVEYVKNVTFCGDVKIIFKTIFYVLKREGISQEDEATMEYFTGTANGAAKQELHNV